MSVSIRAVNAAADAARLCEIYNPYILSTTITYEYDAIDAAEFESRINSVTERFPFLVLETDGMIAGYAYASAFNQRKAYDWDADISIYLDMNMRGRGYGRLLFGKLLDVLTEMGYVNACSLIDIPNPASEALHASFGFRKTGSYDKSGWKGGRWLDMAIYSKRLSDPAVPPAIDFNWQKILNNLNSDNISN